MSELHLYKNLTYDQSQINSNIGLLVMILYCKCLPLATGFVEIEKEIKKNCFNVLPYIYWATSYLQLNTMVCPSQPLPLVNFLFTSKIIIKIIIVNVFLWSCNLSNITVCYHNGKHLIYNIVKTNNIYINMKAVNVIDA